MQPTRLSHVCLSSFDLQSTMDFYCNVLRCSVVHEYKNDNGEVYGVFLLVNNNTFLEFFKTPPFEEGTSCFRHLCFEVEDIHEWLRQLHEQGFSGEIKRGRTDRVLQFWINDPDGNMIEFHQYDPDSVQFKYLS